MTRNLHLFLMWFAVSPLYAGELVEIDIHGMTCPFCVDAVQRNLRKLPDVAEAQVSLELKKVRVHAKSNSIDRDRLRRTIVDAGFTPLDMRQLSHEH